LATALLAENLAISEVPTRGAISEVTAWATILSKVAFRAVETTSTAIVSRRAV
jgi:hypothetical protein